MEKFVEFLQKRQTQHTLPSNDDPLDYSIVTAFGSGEFNTYMNQMQSS
jgi:hypothetical protein